MFMNIVSHLVSAWFAFLLPCYGTWKALSQRPLPEPEIERWGMYWTVIGLFVAFEYTAEWFISWFPFYWETKTLLLLFLALPQTQGSTWVYNTYLQPFFSKNEAELDAGIVSAQTNMVAFIQSRVAQLWDALLKLSAKSQAAAAQQQQPNGQAPAPSAAPNPFGLARGMWDSYAPSVLGAFQRYSSQPTAAPGAPPSAPFTPPIQRPGVSPAPSTQSVHTPGPAFPEPQIY